MLNDTFSQMQKNMRHGVNDKKLLKHHAFLKQMHLYLLTKPNEQTLKNQLVELKNKNTEYIEYFNSLSIHSNRERIKFYKEVGVTQRNVQIKTLQFLLKD